MTDKIPSDYDPADSFRESDGMDLCAECRIVIHQSEYTGPVFDSGGTHYDHYLDTDPMDRPLFCEPCWEELEANQKRAENQSLGDFA